MVRQENGLLLARMALIFKDIDGLRRYTCARFFSTYCVVDESSLVHLYIHLKSTNHAHH